MRALILSIAIFAVAALFLKVGTDKTTAHDRLRHQKRKPLVLIVPRENEESASRSTSASDAPGMGNK